MALREMSSASEALAKLTDEAKWRQIAQLHADEGIIDARSIALMKRQNPSLSDKQFAAMVQKFQASIALDTVRNEYLMHTKLYTWLMRDPVRYDVEKLNEKVYESLFLTPGSDPWLGLFSPDVYTALENGGIVKP